MWAYVKKDKNFKTKTKFLCAVKKHPEWEEWTNLATGTGQIKIPCGQCIDCRLAKSREWANRCILEMKDHEHNYFVTVTYAPEYLPTKDGVNLETGELIKVGTLNTDDHEKFMKDLRRYWEYHYNHQNIRMFMCGEYGELRERPHMHYILFNLPIFDLEFSHKSKKGIPIYTSAIIEKIWGKGRVAIQEVNWEACAYTARYVLKKQTGKGAEDYYNQIGREPEFTRCSRKPGIGWNYFNQNKKLIYQTDEIFIPTKKGIQHLKPAKYYDKLFDIEEPIQMAKIKRARKEASVLVEANKLLHTDKGYTEMQETAEYCKDQQIKALRRKYEKEGTF